MDKEILLEQMKLFEEHYSVIFSNINNVKEKQNIGNAKNRICRFCGLDETKTTFNTVAHAIPECLGNKTIICLDECDTCNKDFAENLEHHLAAITLPFRTINMIEGKKKIPSYQTQNQKARIDIEDAENRFFKITAREDSDFIKLDEENKSFAIEYDLPSHIPSAAYKTLVKMSLSVMPNEELNNFILMNDWIQEKDHSKVFMNPLKVLMTFIPGINPLKETIVFLFKKCSTEEKYPEYTFILAFGNVMYQIIVPSDEEIKQVQSTKTILKFLSPFEINWELGSPTHRILDWSQNTILKRHKEYMEFGYDKINKLDPSIEI